MGSQTRFMILNYATNTIIRWLTSDEVCAIAKALMKMPGTSFDVVDSNHRFVTGHFIEVQNEDTWRYWPSEAVSEK